MAIQVGKLGDINLQSNKDIPENIENKTFIYYLYLIG